jgi:spoIIIJ-associated protein
MNERTTLEKIAPTVEEAVALGLEELGLSKEAVEVEVLDEGSRGLLGIGGRQARVRLMVRAAQSEPAAGAAEEPAKSQAAASQSPAEGVEPTEGDFSVLDDNLLFVSRQTVAELLEKMNISARSTWTSTGMTWAC